ncbi:hypothetical protein [Haladaptatus sp. DFWS20]|uniref:hypothetical protein n=1 Tax=Haladaptatus sp. DFWS20 TaxID=3403467 RepID=UPI003EB9953D
MISERTRRERADRNEQTDVNVQHRSPATSSREHSVRALQQTLGNQAVQELHRSGTLNGYVTAESPVDSPGREAEQAEDTERDGADATPSAPSGPTGTMAETGPAEAQATGKEPVTEPEPETEPPAEEEVGAESAAGEEPAAPEGAGDTAPTSPADDPGFQAVVEQLEAVATRERAHPPATAASAEAQAAAESPETEITSKAAANQVGEMATQEPPPFDRASFKQALLDKVAGVAPKTLEEADEFKESNALTAVKGDLAATVEQETAQTQQPIEEKTEETPDTSKVEPKPTTPLDPPAAGAPPPAVGAARAAPKPKSPAQVSGPFRERQQALDQQLSSQGVTEEQLANANEQAFTAALQTKREAQVHTSQAPVEYRAHEQGVLSNAQSEAEAVADTRTEGMHGGRSELVTQVGDLQEQAKGEDEQQRAEIAANVNQIYETTKRSVTDRLARLDQEAMQAFDQGAEQARNSFESYVDERMTAYKDERYGGVGGWTLWIADKVTSLPPEVNEFYVEGRDRFIDEMETVIDRVATIVETGLVEAKTIIADGREEISEYVASLPDSLEAVGQEAASDIQTQFDELEQTVESKKDQLIDSLAQKYTEKLQQVDARIEELKEANKGLVDKATAALSGVVQTIMQLKDLLLGVLGKAATAVQTIIQDPIGFFGNLVEGVKLGLNNFIAKILTHLQAGLVTWLTGTLSQAGIQLPEEFDLAGIFSLVMQILGLTYENIRAQAVSVLGEETVSALEKTFEIFRVLITEGISGLWRYIQEKVGDLKAMVLDKIQEIIASQVIEAGIKWIIGILSPVGAFIKACKAIYDVVTFFFQRAREVASLVDAILDSILAIAQGNVAGAAKLVEDALARSIPTVIGFLANLLGLGDLPEKIRSVVSAIQEPINRGIQWVLEQAKAAVQRLGGALGIGGEKEVVEADDPEKATKIQAGLAAIDKEERSLGGGGIERQEAEQIASKVEQTHPVFRSITVIDGGDTWDYEFTASPSQIKEGEQKEDMPYETGELVLVPFQGGEAAVVIGKVEVQGQMLLQFRIESGKQRRSRYALPLTRVKKEVENLDARAKGDGPYANIPDPPGVGPFKHFTSEQKAKIIAQNRKRNKGALRSDAGGGELVIASKRARGVPVDPDEVNIDHIFPRSKGGFNSYANAQVVSFTENLRKLDKILEEEE